MTKTSITLTKQEKKEIQSNNTHLDFTLTFLTS